MSFVPLLPRKVAQTASSVGVRGFHSTPASLAQPRPISYNKRTKYSHNNKRVKLGGFKFVDNFKADDYIPDLGPALFRDEHMPVGEDWAPMIRAVDPNRKYTLRKRFLYERNRIILDRSKMALVIQPMTDDQFKAIMDRLKGDFYTSNFRNGLIHIHDKPYAKLKGFFRGPVRVLLQDDDDKCFASLKKFYKVMKEFPTCIYLGGSYDGAVGLAHELEELIQFESKSHAQCQIVSVLNSVSEICPVVDHATSSLARVMHHHGEQLEKKEEKA